MTDRAGLRVQDLEMSTARLAVAPPASLAPPAMGRFERYLTFWVLLCIVLGVVVGQVFPALSQAVGRMEIARITSRSGCLSG